VIDAEAGVETAVGERVLHFGRRGLGLVRRDLAVDGRQRVRVGGLGPLLFPGSDGIGFVGGGQGRGRRRFVGQIFGHLQDADLGLVDRGRLGPVGHAGRLHPRLEVLLGGAPVLFQYRLVAVVGRLVVGGLPAVRCPCHRLGLGLIQNLWVRKGVNVLLLFFDLHFQ